MWSAGASATTARAARPVMAERRVDGFFYGLFMDVAVLEDLGVAPSDPRPAYVDDRSLVVGRRATLVVTPGTRSYGMVIALTHSDLERLYAAPGLEDYRPEPVVAHRLEGGSVTAVCYNLLEPPLPGEADGRYAAELRTLLTELGFPADYVASVGSA